MATKLEKPLCKDSYSNTDKEYLLKFADFLESKNHPGQAKRLRGIAEKNLKDPTKNSFPTN